jgi:hypothetical protein
MPDFGIDIKDGDSMVKFERVSVLTKEFNCKEEWTSMSVMKT